MQICVFTVLFLEKLPFTVNSFDSLNINFYTVTMVKEGHKLHNIAVAFHKFSVALKKKPAFAEEEIVVIVGKIFSEKPSC